MRLTKKQISTIVDAFKDVDPEAKIFLYGSRVDDTLKGGDIDLIVQSERSKELIDQQFRILNLIKRDPSVGDRRIDIKICSPQEFARDPFIASVRLVPLLIETKTGPPEC